MSAHQLKDPDALQAYFNQRVLKILVRLHRHMIAGTRSQSGTSQGCGCAVMAWWGFSDQGRGAGISGLLSAGYYLDGIAVGRKHYLVDLYLRVRRLLRNSAN